MFDLFSICPIHPTKLYTLAIVTPWRCVLSPSGTEPSVSRSHKFTWPAAQLSSSLNV